MNSKVIQKTKKVILVGASGLVGSYCLQMLLNMPLIEEVILLNRKSIQIDHPKIKEYIVNFENLENFLLPINDIDSIFCCIGTTIHQAGSKKAFEKVDYDYVISLSLLGIKYRIKNFLVISSMGADKDSFLFYNRTKGKMENKLSKMNYKSIHIFRPSLLIGDRKKFRLNESLAKKIMYILQPIMQGPLKKFKPISARQVARAMISVSMNSSQGLKIYSSNKIQNIK